LLHKLKEFDGKLKENFANQTEIYIEIYLMWKLFQNHIYCIGFHLINIFGRTEYGFIDKTFNAESLMCVSCISVVAKNNFEAWKEFLNRFLS
jgi:hypothetical protein